MTVVANALPSSAHPFPGHLPVLLSEVVNTLAPRDGGRYVDATYGGGGYTQEIFRRAACSVWAIDRDPAAVARAQTLSRSLDSGSREKPKTLTVAHGTFGALHRLVGSAAPFDGIVLDIGVSSFQLDEAERGFSFQNDGPLDMRMSQAGRSAEDLVNESDAAELADIIFHFGEERYARRIAHAIVTSRASEPIATTGRLADIVRGVVRPQKPGFHPATRTFQALRIAVNDELGELQRVLEQAPPMLAQHGRLAVVTFHSLEDRLVKRAFSKISGRTARPSRHNPFVETTSSPDYELLYTKPLAATEQEVAGNPRARSAKLRALARRSSLPSPVDFSS